MNAFTRSISQVLQGAANALKTFPAAIVSAAAFAIVTIIRIHLEWPEQESFNFLFNCLHWSFGLGAIFSMAAITAAYSLYNERRAFLIANLLSYAVVLITFLALSMYGAMGIASIFEQSKYAVISDIAAARVSVAMFVSFMAFIVLAGLPKEQSDFAKAFFMTHKAFFIASIYGVVLMGGLSGVAGAVQALLYHEMSYKVYSYIATLTGFMSFTIFLGYFPDFRKDQVDERRAVAEKQPRFIEILFVYIMIPITLALTFVLLLWAGQTIMTKTWPSFLRLSGIATSYAVTGLWLHVMVTHHESALAKFYRRVYPVAALVILAFEAWALVVQLNKYGLKVTEYYFALTWVIAVAGSLLLLLWKARAHLPLALLTCLLAVFSVLPVLGYHALPVTAQTQRLEKILVSQGMLANGTLSPAKTEPELAVREAITDAVEYLANASDAKLPDWFDRALGANETFNAKLGFKKTWPKSDDIYGAGSGDYIVTDLYLASRVIDVSDYQWAVSLKKPEEKGQFSTKIDGRKGSYYIYWTLNNKDNIPTLKIVLNDRVLIEQDMKSYIDGITKAYPPGKSEMRYVDLQDMSLKLETPVVTVLLVFSDVHVTLNLRQDTINYALNLDVLYLKEKP